MDIDIEDSSAQDGTIMSLHGKGIQLVGEVAYINDGLRQVLSSLTSSSQPRPIIRTRGTSSPSGYSGNARRAMCASRKAAASNFELNNDDNGAKSKAEDATIYFCLRSGISYDSADEAQDNWFSIRTWHMPLSTDRFIRPIFKEPGRAVTYHDTPPIAVGPYIFIIHKVEKTNDEEMPSRSVFYRDTRNKSKDGWMEAPRLHGDTNGYYFFHANDKIYGLGILGRSYFWGGSYGDPKDLSFDLRCLDCRHELNQGWQSIYSNIPIDSIELSNHCSNQVQAFKLEYATTTDSATGKTKHHARRALIFITLGCWISYDFERNEFNVSKKVHQIFEELYDCEAVSLGDVFYCLIKDEWQCVLPLMAYINPFSADKGYETPVLGEGRLCILWAEMRPPTKLIYCTVFNVCVEGDDEKPHAVNVSTRVYKARGARGYTLHAVAISGKMISQFMKRESTQQQAGGWFEGSTSKIGDEGRGREVNEEEEEEEKKKKEKRKKKKNRRG
ncbi:unnamed protein product [Cuscuta campestris]|uniref:Uncharacterized protein n=1 Tax=Cuscuta campestris TaxID=132261 RepID=A0A484MQH7_9ASTE|nr:unnamed protein product [Cuscuta campestris]